MAEKKSALIIANSQYEDPVLRQLVAPAQDAEALAQVLRDPVISGFEVQVILNEPRHRVEEEIEAFFVDRDRDDLLLLYFSGHGVTDEDGLLYYAARNTFHKRLRSTAVSANFVNDGMTRCRSRRQVLLLDCCYSGAFARAKAAPAVNTGQHFGGRTPEEGRGRFVLTASDAYQYSFEGGAVEGQAVYSLFTQALVQGLRTGEADLDSDGLITLDELYQYVHRSLKEQNPRQSPRKWESDVEGGLVIGLNPRPAEAPLPEDLLHAIENLIPEARLKAIPRLEKLMRGKHRGLALAAHRALLSLVEDDSRRVSSAAQKCMASYAEQLSASEAPPRTAAVAAPVVSQPKAGEQRLATEKARVEPEEREGQAAAAERQPVIARVHPGEDLSAAPKAKEAIEDVWGEPLQPDFSKTLLASTGPTTSKTRLELEERERLVVAAEKLVTIDKAIGLAALGCGASCSLAVVVYLSTNILLGALFLFAGLAATGAFTFKRVVADRTLPNLIVFAAAWGLALSMFWIFTSTLYIPFMVRNLFVMAGLGATLAIGVLWASRQLGKLPLSQVTAVSAGWAVGWVLAWGLAFLARVSFKFRGDYFDPRLLRNCNTSLLVFSVFGIATVLGLFSAGSLFWNLTRRAGTTSQTRS